MGRLVLWIGLDELPCHGAYLELGQFLIHEDLQHHKQARQINPYIYLLCTNITFSSPLWFMKAKNQLLPKQRVNASLFPQLINVYLCRVWKQIYRFYHSSNLQSQCRLKFQNALPNLALRMVLVQEASETWKQYEIIM